MIDLGDQLERLAVPLDRGHIVGLDPFEQAAGLVDDHFFGDPGRAPVHRRGRAGGSTARSRASRASVINCGEWNATIGIGSFCRRQPLWSSAGDTIQRRTRHLTALSIP